jgi:hypothetical protein
VAKHPKAIPPERQRRFDRAFAALAALCPGRERRLSDFKRSGTVPSDPLDLERARWLLIAMGLARGTEGGAAIAGLARLGYIVTCESRPFVGSASAAPLDTPGLLYLGQVLPTTYLPWKRLEAGALAVDATDLRPRIWCSTHETIQVQAALIEQGHLLG